MNDLLKEVEEVFKQHGDCEQCFVSSQNIVEGCGLLGHNAIYKYSTILKLGTAGFSETLVDSILPNYMTSHPTGP
jgi:hypothetical protein